MAPEKRLAYLKETVLRETGGKADPAIVDHWLHLADQHATVRFRYPGSDGTAKTATVFDCQDARPNEGDYGACSAIAGPNALSMGILTSASILHVRR